MADTAVTGNSRVTSSFAPPLDSIQLVDASVAKSGAPLLVSIPLFSVTGFVSASLLFFVQPMVARLVLPRLGGAPSVWNTCVLFFQTTLLFGYLYADLAMRWLGVRRQARWHVAILLVPLAFLPLAIGAAQPPTSSNPVWWLLGMMAARVGTPFFVVAASAPLLQRWFSTLPMRSARDPYFLYAASNVGSMAALISYPFVFEPSTGLAQQTRLWSVGYFILVILLASCALYVNRYGVEPRSDHAGEGASDDVTVQARFAWLLFSVVPSSLMLGVTTHISTDVAAVPLLWVLPLALYLASFVVAFSSIGDVFHKWLVRVLPLFVLTALVLILVNLGAWWSIALHLATFLICALVCHRELARRRPSVRHLTEYYIWMSFGGMLGGTFNTLVAPLVFSRILEYPLALAAASLIRPSPGYRRLRPESFVMLFGVPSFVSAICIGLAAAGLLGDIGWQPLVLTLLLALAIAYMFANRPQAFGFAAVMIVGAIVFFRPSSAGRTLFAGRSFFGVHRVIDAPDHSYHLLQHGVTTHGRQQLSTVSGCDPTGYYHPSGPIGQLFGVKGQKFQNVAVIGLGTGALSCYSNPQDTWTFYEIDPMIERIARETRYFTYLANSHAHANVVLGDGRLTLQKATPGYDLVVVDAFSSDAIPVHLLTREAVKLYFSKLKRDGILALHISNGYLNLEPVITALSQQQRLFALANLDTQIPAADAKVGRLSSHWVLLATSDRPLTDLINRPGWHPPIQSARVQPWTDDYSNILHVLKFH
jgi:spermine/spermidine synthase